MMILAWVQTVAIIISVALHVFFFFKYKELIYSRFFMQYRESFLPVPEFCKVAPNELFSLIMEKESLFYKIVGIIYVLLFFGSLLLVFIILFIQNGGFGAFVP